MREEGRRNDLARFSMDCNDERIDAPQCGEKRTGDEDGLDVRSVVEGIGRGEGARTVDGCGVGYAQSNYERREAIDRCTVGSLKSIRGIERDENEEATRSTAVMGAEGASTVVMEVRKWMG